MIADSFTETFNGYIDDVLSGRIVAGQLVRAACTRHLKDIERQSTPEFPYHFSIATARKYCSFYPKILRHSIGRYAGMPFELEPWQIFCEGSIFGWLRDADGTRRFRTSYETKGRKNGKSTRVAGRAILMARYDHNPVAAARRNKNFMPEPVAQVVLCATKREQADKVIFAEVERMRRKSPSILSSSDDANKQIRFFANDGEIITVGSDKPYDGLNPHFIAMDEIHAWREYHREFYDTMVTGSGYRDQPLVSYVTTAGSDSSELWKEIYGYAKSVVLGTVEDESYFCYIAEIDDTDDPLDESVWIKANPNLGVSVSLDYLREQAKKARQSPLAMNRFKRYHANIMVTSTEAAFDLQQWDACRGELSDWKGADAVGGGVDLGGRDDLAAYALVARFPAGEITDDEGETKTIWRYEVRTSAYISNHSKRNLSDQPFAGWIYSGKLRRCNNPITQLTRDFSADCFDTYCQTFAYDPAQAQQFAEQMTTEGLTPIRMGQNCSMFNEPICDLLEAIKDGRLTHDGDPLLRWCVSNAVVVTNNRLQVMFDKSSSSEKIDPVVAMVMAFRICSLAAARPQGRAYL